jgi:transposase
MLALDSRVVEAIWHAVEPWLPKHTSKPHPLGCHRARIPDRACLVGIVIRLVTGCSWDVAGRLSHTSESTLRRRRDEWVAANVFGLLVEEALAAYDRIVGLDVTDLAIDGSQQKAPFGGEGTGPSVVDRRKQGWKWSIATGRDGIPVAWTISGAHRNDCILFEPTLDVLDGRGLLDDVECVHLDRGYDYPFVVEACEARGLQHSIARRRPPGKGRYKLQVPLGMRWPVERTNSWLTNYGQLRRNTDRSSLHRIAQLELAIAFIITIKLVKWADRWQPA